MKTKLLSKTLRSYVLFSLIVLLVSAPLFYFLSDKLFIDDADEALLLRKREFNAYNIRTLRITDIPTWNKFNRDIKIETNLSSVTRDSIFYRSYIDTLANNEDEPYRVLLSPITIEQKPFLLMVRINLVESADMIKSIALLFCLILGALLVGLYFITRRLSSKLWRPFYSTLEKVENFELDKNIKPEFAQSDIEEFSRLNHSIDRMLERNVSVYKNQKEFIENAAHELQTPLAVFQVKLDSLAQQLPFTDKLGEILSDLNDSASRLNRLNKNLLLLSKIEDNQYAASDAVSLSDLLQKQAAFLQEQAEERKIQVYLKPPELLTVQANLTLLEIAIANLLLNALRHNVDGGQVFVSLQQQTLTVSNNGHAPLDSEKLFQRFSRVGSEGGNGLGLAIVKKIADLHGWSVSYKYQDGKHVFEIIF